MTAGLAPRNSGEEACVPRLHAPLDEQLEER